jgi:hypothetical protein
MSLSWEGELAIVEDAESSFVIAPLDGSYQIRQTLVLSDEGYDDGVETALLELMTALNNRFSCCKVAFDGGRNLVNICDVPSSVVSTTFLREMLDQVDYMSAIGVELAKSVIATGETPSENEIDAAFTLLPAN